MKAGKFIDGVLYSWEEIYELTGCCREDFLYDTSGECYNLLMWCILARTKGSKINPCNLKENAVNCSTYVNIHKNVRN